MYTFDIITLFPDLVKPYFKESILKRAIESKSIKIRFWNPMKYSQHKWHNVDDTPCGGGEGMILAPQPMYDCIMAAKKVNNGPVVFMSPGGTKFNQKKAEKYSKNKAQSLILVCGRYEGMDQRVIDLCVDEELSIGDYVLAGGELPALVVLEGVSRLISGVLGNEDSHLNDSFSENLDRKKKYPVYTKPAEFMGLHVPDVLLSGHHKKIEEWRKSKLK
jgi:tRNA (guanine37-N1)-methyltransferase